MDNNDIKYDSDLANTGDIEGKEILPKDQTTDLTELDAEIHSPTTLLDFEVNDNSDQSDDFADHHNEDKTNGKSNFEPGKKRSYAYLLSGIFLLGFVFIVMVLTLDDMGLTDDDDFYVPAAKDYISWVENNTKAIFKGDFSWFSKEKIGRKWWNNHEHPSIAKLVMGASWLVLHKWTDLMGQVNAARMGVVFMAMMMFYLVFRFSWEIFGPKAAWFAVLALLTMPRTFYHSHVGTLDIPTASTVFLVIYAAWRAEKSKLWVIWAGIFYGVAMCTKLNGPFVVFPLLLYWFYRWRQDYILKSLSDLPVKRMFHTGLSMAFISFPVFVLLWPWLYHDTFNRLVEYFNFHFHHYGIRLLYLGDIYISNPVPPWHAPFVYALYTTPLVLIVLGLWGMFYGFKQLAPSNLKQFKHGSGSRYDYALLMAANVAFAIGIVAFPENPKYGGVKLFQPLYPCFAVLAGFGFQLLWEKLEAIKPVFKQHANALSAILIFLLIMPGAIGMIRVYPYMLSYYNSLAGNLQGATETGMERQYYDVNYPSMIEFWNESGFINPKVSYEPNMSEYKRTYPWYKRDGILKANARIVNQDRAEFMILTHERRWHVYFDLLNKYRKFPELHTEKIWGVPLYTIYDLRDQKKIEKEKREAERKRKREEQRKIRTKQREKKKTEKKVNRKQK